MHRPTISFIKRYTPQFIAHYLINCNDITVAIDFTLPSIRWNRLDPHQGFALDRDAREFDNRACEGGYYLAHTAISENAEYRSYLKLLMSLCLKHLNHLPDSEFVNEQVSSQAAKTIDSLKFTVVADSFDGFDRVFDKQYKLDNYSFCFCMILYMLIRRSISVVRAGRNKEALRPLTKKQFAASANKIFVTNFPNNAVAESFNHWAISWPTDLTPPTHIHFYALKLLVLLIKVRDKESVLALVSNPLFKVHDTASLATAIELAISSENKPLLIKLTTILQSIEPKHPAIALANSCLRKFELYRRSSFSVEEINKMSGVDFEFALRNALSKHSNFESVEVTRASGDYGADLILTTRQRTRIAVQCKRFLLAPIES